MIGLTYLEVYLSICNITLECIKFKFYNILDLKCRTFYERMSNELEMDLGISGFTYTDLQCEFLGLIIIGKNRTELEKKG